MSLNDTPSGERAHIVFFGVRNAGKSSLVNALTNQTVSVVSDVAGTTTDPVRKAMELAPAGPVLIVDTPGIDDAGDVGDLRVQRAEAALNEADVAVLVVDATRSLTPFDEKLLAAFQTRRIPYVIAENKADLLAESGRAGAAESSLPSPRPGTDASDSEPLSEGADHNATASAENDGASARAARVRVSALTGEGLSDLKRALATLATGAVEERRLVGDLLTPGDVVVLVIPLDSAAPKGRIILPQQQVMRDALDAGAFPCATGVEGLPDLLAALARPPRLVVTDSQAFGEVDALLPADVPLTSFSILMARYKGDLAAQLEAVRALESLTDEDTVLIAEGCTHHRQCEDIGTVKIPRWLSEYTGKDLQLEHSSGRDFPEDLSPYQLVIHCGGCMLNGREMDYRRKTAGDAGVPFTNYGITIAHLKGILKRSVELFPDLYALLP